MESKQSEHQNSHRGGVRVLSLDFDGCLFNDHYYGPERYVIKSNYSFLSRLKQENNQYEKVYSLIGSNRQSVAVDRHNYIKDSVMVGSCFPAMIRVNQYLEVVFDSFLLADLYGNLRGGISFQCAIDPGYTGRHSDWIFDHTKITLLYAQMHRKALQHLDKEIVFDFYDDKHQILRRLGKFYSAHPELVPRNIRLRLNHYSGGMPTLMLSISGI